MDILGAANVKLSWIMWNSFGKTKRSLAFQNGSLFSYLSEYVFIELCHVTIIFIILIDNENKWSVFWRRDRSLIFHLSFRARVFTFLKINAFYTLWDRLLKKIRNKQTYDWKNQVPGPWFQKRNSYWQCFKGKHPEYVSTIHCFTAISANKCNPITYCLDGKIEKQAGFGRWQFYQKMRYNENWLIQLNA